MAHERKPADAIDRSVDAGVLSPAESDIINYRLVFRRLLLSSEENKSLTEYNFDKMFLLCKRIFSADAVAKVFLYLCLYGAATAWVVQYKLNLSEPTAYRALKQLRTLKIIRPAIKLPRSSSSRGGPRPVVWSIDGARTEEISDAVQLHARTLSPKYRVAEEAAQTILDKYILKRGSVEISYKEIVLQVRLLRIPFNASDVADLAAQYLHERGIKVWR